MISLRHAPTVALPGIHVVRRGRDWQQLVTAARGAAQLVVQAVWPEQGLKALHAHAWAGYHGVSRARNGSDTCPVYRLSIWILALRAVGAARGRAQQLVDHLQALVDTHWPAAAADVGELMQLEQALDGAEDVHQLRYAASRDPNDIPAYLAALREHHAVQGSLIAALAARVPTPEFVH